jgi:peptidoglycan/LPS O-acetylase OafA/YrhL
VLVPALVIGMTIDVVGSHFLADRPVYASSHYNVMIDHQISSMISTRIFFGNLANVQDMYVPTLGSNHPLWSLTNEWWYYILFPILLAVIANRRRKKAYFFLVLSALIIWILTPSVRELFVVWLMGAGVSLIPRGVVKTRYRWACLFCLLVLLVLGSMKVLPHWAGDIHFLALGAVTSTLVYLICCSNEVTRRGVYRKIAVFLSKISYSLYLTHMPLIAFVSAFVITAEPKMIPTIGGMAKTATLVLVAIIYSTGMWYLFERRTPEVRKLLTRVFSKAALIANK